MEAEIRLPGVLGRAADLFAAQRGMSRSQLCAKALAEYLTRHQHDDVTGKIDATLVKVGAGDGHVGEAGAAAIRTLEW